MHIRGMIVATLFSAALVGLASSQPPPGGEKRPKGKFKGPQEVKERPEALKVDLKEPPVGLVKNPRFFDKSADVNVPATYTRRATRSGFGPVRRARTPNPASPFSVRVTIS